MLLQLQKISLAHPLDTTGTSLVLTELILPRNAIQAKRAFLDVDLKKGQRSLARAPFYEKALLKEKVEGRFGLKVSVTRPLQANALGSLLRQLAATAIESTADGFKPLSSLLASNPVTMSLLPDLIGEAGAQLADRVADDTPVFIAMGGLDLDSETLQSGGLVVPLKLTESVKDYGDLKLSERRDKRKRAGKTLRSGTKIGEVVLQLEA